MVLRDCVVAGFGVVEAGVGVVEVVVLFERCCGFLVVGLLFGQ